MHALAVGARYKVNVRLCYGTFVLCISHCLLTFCLSLLNCYLIFCYLMLYLYALFVLIYLLLNAYFDFCLSVFFWLITSHKSILDLGIDPSRASVKLSRATLGTPSRHPSFLLGDLRYLRVHNTEQSVHPVCTYHSVNIVWSYRARIYFMVLRLTSESAGRKTGIAKFSNTRKVSLCNVPTLQAKNKGFDVIRRFSRATTRSWPKHTSAILDGRDLLPNTAAHEQPRNFTKSSFSTQLSARPQPGHQPSRHSRTSAVPFKKDDNRLQNGGDAVNTMHQATCCRQGFSHKNADIHRNRWS